jgi:hypothetical protein
MIASRNSNKEQTNWKSNCRRTIIKATCEALVFLFWASLQGFGAFYVLVSYCRHCSRSPEKTGVGGSTSIVAMFRFELGRTIAGNRHADLLCGAPSPSTDRLHHSTRTSSVWEPLTECRMLR